MREPVAQWSFEESSNAGIRDIKTMEIASAVGTTNPAPNAKVGASSRSFDGAASSHLKLKPNALFSPGNNGFTVAAWVNPEALDGKEHYIWKDPLSSATPGVALRVNASQQFQAIFKDTEGKILSPAAPSPAAAGKWTHLAAVRSGRSCRIYVNGVLEAEQSVAGFGAVAAPGTPSIGESWQGLLDDVRVYDRALSTEEVAALFSVNGAYLSAPLTGPSERTKWMAFQATRAAPPAEPLARPADHYWPFDGDAKDLAAGVSGAGPVSFKDDFPPVAYRNSKSLLVGSDQDILKIPGSGLNPSGDLQLSFWLRTRLSKGVLLQKGPVDDGYEVSLAGDGTILFKRNDTIGAQGKTRVNDGEWHHVVCGTNGLYVDGSPEAATPAATSFVPSGAAGFLYVGSVPGVAPPSPVSIDDLAIYGRALSPADIGLLAAGVKRPYVPQPGSAYEKKLLGLWRLDGDWSNSAGGAAGLAPPPVSPASPGLPVPAFVTGVSGAAANFSPTMGVSRAAIDVGSSRTLALWVKTRSTNMPVLFAGGAPLVSINETGLLAYTNLTCPLEMTDGNWHHVAVLNDGTLYFDGQKVGKKTSGGTLGGSIVVGNGSFTGQIDEIAAFDALLNDGEILDLYKRGALQLKYQFSTGSFASWSGGGVPARGTAGVWRFNETIEESSRESAADPASAGSLVPGKVGNAIQIAGDAVKITPRKSLALGLGGMTVSAWVKRELSTGQAGSILSRADGAFALGFDGGNKPIFSVAGATASSSLVIEDMDWHHVAGVFSGGSRLEIYLDGVLAGSSGAPPSIPPGSNSLDLGKGGAKLIDELALYDRALAPAEVWSLYETASYVSSDEAFLLGLNRDKESKLRYRALFTPSDYATSPVLTSASVYATGHNRAGTYAITSLTKRAFTYLTGFEQALDRPLSSGENVTHSLSPNEGRDWYFVNSAGAWEKAPDSLSPDDPVEGYSSTAVAIQGAIAGFDNATYAPTKGKGYGDLRIRSFLTSDGTSSPSLDTLAVPYHVASVRIVEDPALALWAGQSPKIPCLLTSPTGASLGDLTLEFSRDGGESYLASDVILDRQSFSDGATPRNFEWKLIPAIKVDDVKLRISSASAAAVSDETDKPLSISASIITVTSPTAASAWDIGSEPLIQWRIDGPIDPDAKIKIFWASANDANPDPAALDWKLVFGMNENTGAPATPTGSYQWFVPDAAFGKTMIKVGAFRWNAEAGISEIFTVPISINLASPASGVKWAAGSKHLVEWTTFPSLASLPPSSRVAIQYSRDRQSWVDITGSAPNNGQYEWTPDPKKDAGSQIWIRIKEVGGMTTAESGVFTVSSITVDSPNAPNTRWEAVSAQTVAWTSAGVGKVNILYSESGTFADAVMLAQGLASKDGGNSAPFDWGKFQKIRTTLTAKIRVEDADQPEGSAFAADTADNPFVIYGKIGLLNPDPLAPPAWKLGKKNTIRWETIPANVEIPAFKIKIVDARRPDFQVIPEEESTVTATSFDWVPNLTSLQVTVFVSDASDPTVGASADFKVGGSGIRLIDGISGLPADVFTIGQPMSIILDRDVVTATNMVVDVEFLVGENVEKSIFKNQPIGKGSSVPFNWPAVSDRATRDATIHIQQKLAGDNPEEALEVYSEVFTIKPSLSLVGSPGTLKGDEETSVKVETMGSISTIAIYFSKSGFDESTGEANSADVREVALKDTKSLTGGTVKKTLTLDWKVPADVIAPAAQIKVVAKEGEMELFAISNPFKVTGTMELVPFADTYLGELGKPIRWKASGNIGPGEKVKIELLTSAAGYSEAAGQTLPIVETVNNGAYAWSVMLPESVIPPPKKAGEGTPVKLKVSLVSDRDVKAVSDEFLIKWARVRFKVVDIENGGMLSGLGVSDMTLGSVETDPPRPWSNWAESDLSSGAGIAHFYPYGRFGTVWSRAAGDYFDKSVEFTVDAPDQVVVVKMERLLSVPMTARLSASYDAKSRRLSANVWVERNGMAFKDLSRLGPASLTIYDKDGAQEITTLQDDAANSNAAYEMQWVLDKDSPQLKPGVLYFTEQRVLVDGAREVVNGGSIEILSPVEDLKTKFSYSYDARNKTLSANIWVEEGGMVLKDGSRLGAGSLTIYDNAGTQEIISLQDDAANSSGVYEIQWTLDKKNPQLKPGVLYFAKQLVLVDGDRQIMSSGSLEVTKPVEDIKAKFSTSYDAKNKKLSVNVWVEENGATIKSRSRLGPGYLTIYDKDGTQEIISLRDDVANFKGVYEMQWFLDKNRPQLAPGVLYLTEQRVLVDDDREVVNNGSLEIVSPVEDIKTKFSYSYDAKNKKLSANIWVEENGAVLKNRTRLGPAYLTIYDKDGVQEIVSLRDDVANTNGIYEMQWILDKKDPELKPGVLYFTKHEILVDQDREMTGSGSIEISQAEGITTLVNQVSAIATDTSQATEQIASVETRTTEIQKQTADFSTKIADVRVAVGTAGDTGSSNTVFGKVAEVLKSTGDVSESGPAKRNLQQQLFELQKRSAKAPKIVQRMTQAAPGETVKVQFQSDSGLIPRADIYTPDNKLVVKDARLGEIGNTGLYEFRWSPGASTPLGDYTVIVQEPANGNVDSMSVKIKKPEETIALPASASVPAGETDDRTLKPFDTAASEEAETAKKPEETAESVELATIKKSLDALMAKIEEMQKSGKLSSEEAEAKKEEIAAAAPRTFTTGPALTKDLAASQEQVKSLAESQGIDLGNLMQLTQEQTAEIKSQSEEIKALRNYIERINAILDALNSTVGADKPIVKDWMETA